MRYTGQDMTKSIDEYTALFSQLEFMGKDIAIHEAHKAPMLLASIDPTSELEPIAAALRFKDGADLTWEYVATTLIDEFNSRQGPRTKSGRAERKREIRKNKSATRSDVIQEYGSSSEEFIDVKSTVRTLDAAMKTEKFSTNGANSSEVCEFCNKRGHVERTCFLNPDNPENRIPQKTKN